MALLITIRDRYQKVSGVSTKYIIIVIMQDMFTSNGIFNVKFASLIFKDKINQVKKIRYNLELYQIQLGTSVPNIIAGWNKR